MKIKLLKLFSFRMILIFLLLMAGVSQVSAQKNDIADEQKIKGIVSKMTLTQKAQLLIGTGMYFELPDSIKKMMGPMFKQEENTDPEYKAMVDRIRTFVPGAAGNSSEYPSLGITTQVLCDGPAGLRISPIREGVDGTFYCTAFPIGTVLASTWDTELVTSVGKAMGSEVKEYGADVLLAPALNIQRDLLCGRNFEYYSEDPLIAGKMAAAMVNGIQSNGVGTSIKHFAANNSETNRMSVNTIVSERALREIYLKGFEIAVKEAQPWTVMSSYNKINGIYASESHDLLTKILRNDWGFKGYVMTDWGGGSDVTAQMIAGNDMIQPGTPKQIDELLAAVKAGKLDEKVLDTNVERILRVMLLTPHYNQYKNSNKPNLKAHAAVTRQVATDGMVLLKNEQNTLPFSSKVKNIAAFGNTSYDFIAGGTGSGDVNEAYTISLIDGLKNGGFTAEEELSTLYQQYIKATKATHKPKNFLAALMGGKEPVAEMEVSKELADKMAAKSDIALITIGRNAGEGQDRTTAEGDFSLTATEKAMIQTVTEAFRAKGKKAVVVLNIAGVIEMVSWNQIPDAILLAWQPGQEGGNSVVDILSGKVNPSGKLAVTIPKAYADAPTAKNFPGTEIKSDVVDNAADLSGFSFMRRVPWQIVYEEDIYVGYRYYNTFNVPVAYEFGYGLSYTSYNYGKLKVDKSSFNGEITASIEIKNSGKVAGREAVQIYVKAPAGQLNKPEQVLVAFGKTKLLNPGESQTLTFKIESKDIASFNDATSAWVVEAGDYQLMAAASSLNIKQQATFKVASEINAGKVSKSLTPTQPIAVLKK